MNKDFRITTDALDHPKLVKLKRILGTDAILCLLRLWGFTARYHPKGKLNAMTADDIEISAGWNGETGLFIFTLLSLKLLDESQGKFSIHDWKEHNGYCYYAPERSIKSKKAANARWEIKQCPEHASSNASSNAPLPSPLPLPSPKDLADKSAGIKPPELPKEPEEPEPKKRKTIYEMNYPPESNGKFIQIWHKEYLAVHGSHYTGDIKKMAGQVRALTDRGTTFAELCISRQCFMDEPANEFNGFHHFDTFIKGFSRYLTKAKEGKIKYEF